MRNKEFCDGCGNVISEDVKPWTFDADKRMLYVTHPNERCRRALFARHSTITEEEQA